MEDTAFVGEAGSSEEVGVRVEVGKRRKVARQGRFSGGGGGSGGRLDVEEAIRQLHLLSEEDRERCIRPFTVQSDEDLSGLSDENSGGAASFYTVWVMLIFLWESVNLHRNSFSLVGSGKEFEG